jgi:hypothetical protein
LHQTLGLSVLGQDRGGGPIGVRGPVYEVDDAQAFAQHPSGIRESAAIGA